MDQALKEIKSNLDELMMDTYANYMFQSMIHSCIPEQRLFILQQVPLYFPKN
jgi:hypothetical protein